ncbi:FMN-dependent dehydrogenase, includes L-lactate dehydrogenase and type II isopentenyl diphosphate isomerase [Amphibacillus marinus]|uniref:L-lactate oxidase n=1 Tax=Amphibacillus marinus TaxID=872970 RepID=A0A1H8MA88_9BACI|nr:alpha-hydroxy-acid oxidizing protein [Amphibacillus marinus]SEO14214.1 FMN-dependent dehydrogenase, includes L-lactate dehydrogenase and type II isopentenyl diphosphate isomerase [Amphibacillus marinus]
MSSMERFQTDLPFSFHDWEELAQQELDPGAFGYIQSGSGNETTLRHNEQAFEKWSIIPRVLADVSAQDPTVKLFSREHQVPILLAPVGFQGIVHPEGERASASSASENGFPFITSTVSSVSIEGIAKLMNDVPYYFQLYWPNDHDVAVSFIKRAEQAQYAGIVVTVDTPFLGWRERDLSNHYFPMQTGAGIENFVSDQVFQAKYNSDQSLTKADFIKTIQSILFKQNLTWRQIEWLKEQTQLPIILKGVLHPEDARRAAALGVDGLIVSNHGGRQLDGVISGLDALPEIVTAVGNELTILMDGGVRRGADIIKALALGADAVLLGRPYVYGLVKGQRGVTAVLTNLKKDFVTGLAISGVTSPSELNSAIIKRLG